MIQAAAQLRHAFVSWAANMQVCIGYECYDNGCDIWKTVAKVFDDEVKALIWKEELVLGDVYTEWREYTKMDVE
jgi:hypothetical protein